MTLVIDGTPPLRVKRRSVLFGCLLSNGTGADGHGGTTEVKDARVLYDPRAVNLNLEMSLAAAETTFRGAGPQLVSSRRTLQSFWDEASQSYRTPDPSDPAVWDGILSYTVQLPDGSTQAFGTWAEAIANAAPASRGRLERRVLEMTQGIANEVTQAQNNWSTTHQSASINLDLNKFLQTKDKMRLVWESEN